jgi:hypothetical protein
MHLITDLKTIPINKAMRICLFYTENMYTNIPKIETTDIITSILKINENSQKEIIRILETVMEQNYFQSEQKYYKQMDKLWVLQYQQYWLKHIFKPCNTNISNINKTQNNTLDM